MRRTRIIFDLRTKSKKQLPLFMIIKEYYDEQGCIEFAKVIFEIKGRKYRNLLKKGDCLFLESLKGDGD